MITQALNREADTIATNRGQGHKKIEQRDIEDARLDRGAVATSQGIPQLPETNRSWNSLDWSSTPDAACSDHRFQTASEFDRTHYVTCVRKVLCHLATPLALTSWFHQVYCHLTAATGNSCKHLLPFPLSSISPNQMSLMLLPLAPSSL